VKIEHGECSIYSEREVPRLTDLSIMATVLHRRRGVGEDVALLSTSRRSSRASRLRKWWSNAMGRVTCAGSTVADVGNEDDGDKARGRESMSSMFLVSWRRSGQKRRTRGGWMRRGDDVLWRARGHSRARSGVTG
jgi:hypothetical protein